MRNVFVRSLGVTAALGVMAQQASAAVDASVTTALDSAGSDAATIGAAVLVVLVGIAAFKYLRRAL